MISSASIYFTFIYLSVNAVAICHLLEQVATFSNASLLTHAGLFVGANATCAASPTNNTAVMQFPKLGSKVGRPVPVGFQIFGATLTIACDPAGGAVHVNADASSCFLFGGSAPFLPATPIELNCSSSGGGIR